MSTWNAAIAAHMTSCHAWQSRPRCEEQLPHGPLSQAACGSRRAQHRDFRGRSGRRLQGRQSEPHYGQRAQSLRRDGARFSLSGVRPAARNLATPAALGQCLQLGRPPQRTAAVAGGRILHPAPVVGSVAVVVGLLAAAANWGVARLLLAPSRNNAAIRLAYIHNIGDVYVSLAPVAAGLLVSLSIPLIAAGIAVWIIASTVREAFASSEELIWPEKIVCGHSDHEGAGIGAAPSQP